MEKEKAEIARLVEKYGRIQSLMKYVNSDTLKESYRKQPKGKAVGIDGITKEEYGENLEENIGNLLVRMKKFSYKPYPVRRAYIPKGNGKMRGLGIPSFEDKIVQGVFKEIPLIAKKFEMKGSEKSRQSLLDEAMDNSFLHRKKLLLVDDEPDLLKMVSDILKDAGFEAVLTAASVKEAVMVAKQEKPDLMILDVMLPDGDGFSLMEQLRTFTDVPVIFLTAKDEAADKLAGLGLGADDYISKPFMPQELLLRVYAVLRRTYKEDSPLVILDGCTIDFSRAEVNKGGEVISLTAKEHTLLETLARNEGKIVTLDALCEALWGDNPFGYENSLNAHVRRIREKIEADPSKPVSLITIKGLGYKLITRK